MKRLKNITILLCFLSLFAFISCSAEDKTGINNPPEDTEITDGETGIGSSSGDSSGAGGTGSSEEGEGEPETTETIEEIDAEGFPTELFGTYRDERLPNEDKYRNAEVSLFGQDIWLKGYQKFHKKDDGKTGIQVMDVKIKKWKKTTKGGKIIKLEGESLYKDEETIVAKTTITFDYENKTVSMTFTTYTPTGADASFEGKKIN